MRNDLKTLFDELNANCRYLVLRNWEDIFSSNIYASGHADIDILCDNLPEFVNKTGAYRVHNNKYRDNFVVPYEDIKVRFDIRWVGDGYYPTQMEKEMLDNRVFNDVGIYIPAPAEYFYSLSYHALLQKKSLSDEYKNKLQRIYKDVYGKEIELTEETLLKFLSEFFRKKNMKIVLPNDPAVYLNTKNMVTLGYKRNWSRLIRRIFYKLRSRILASL